METFKNLPGLSEVLILSHFQNVKETKLVLSEVPVPPRFFRFDFRFLILGFRSTFLRGILRKVRVSISPFALEQNIISCIELNM